MGKVCCCHNPMHELWSGPGLVIRTVLQSTGLAEPTQEPDSTSSGLSCPTLTISLDESSVTQESSGLGTFNQVRVRH